MTTVTMQVECFPDIQDALDEHKRITGSDFFECYQNTKPSTIRIANDRRECYWMVDRVTGDIYYLTRCPDKLLMLNKLSLGCYMNDSLFHEVNFNHEDNITITSRTFSRSRESRIRLAANDIVVTTL